MHLRYPRCQQMQAMRLERGCDLETLHDQMEGLLLVTIAEESLFGRNSCSKNV